MNKNLFPTYNVIMKKSSINFVFCNKIYRLSSDNDHIYIYNSNNLLVDIIDINNRTGNKTPLLLLAYSIYDALI